MVDLDGPVFLKADRGETVRYEDGMISCSVKALGVKVGHCSMRFAAAHLVTVAEETVRDARAVKVRLLHDADHPSVWADRGLVRAGSELRDRNDHA